MMKYTVCLFLCLFLAWEMTAFSSEGMSDFRTESVSQEATYVSCADKSDCFFVAPNEGHAGCKISDVILFEYAYLQSSLFSKLLKLKIIPVMRTVLRSLYVRLSADRSPSLSFTPNSIRYSCGYYIYTLSHILI